MFDVYSRVSVCKLASDRRGSSASPGVASQRYTSDGRNAHREVHTVLPRIYSYQDKWHTLCLLTYHRDAVSVVCQGPELAGCGFQASVRCSVRHTYNDSYHPSHSEHIDSPAHLSPLQINYSRLKRPKQ